MLKMSLVFEFFTFRWSKYLHTTWGYIKATDLEWDRYTPAVKHRIPEKSSPNSRHKPSDDIQICFDISCFPGVHCVNVHNK